MAFFRMLRAPAAFCAVLILVVSRPVAAQPYARFAVPDSQRVAAIRASGAGFENIWNALLISALRAEVAGADSAAALGRLAGAVAAAETPALGSHIGHDALMLLMSKHWLILENQRVRIAAAVSESLGAAAQSSGDFTRADSLFSAALGAYRKFGEKRREAWVLGSMGQNAFTAHQIARADSLYRLALTARQAIGDARMIGNTLNSLGSTAYSVARYADAYAWYQQARATRERTGDRGPLANTLGFLGVTAGVLGQPDSARVWHQAALDMAVAAGDSAITATVLTNFAQFLGSHGEPDRAIRFYARALPIAVSRGDLKRQWLARTYRGDLLRQLGRFTEAVAEIDEAVALAEANRNPGDLQTSLVYLGRAWLGLRDAAHARPPLERGLALADSMGDVQSASGLLNNLSICARIEGDVSGAQRLGERALAAAIAAGDSSLVHDAAATLGAIADDRGDFEASSAWWQRAAGAGENMDAENRASDSNNLGVAAVRLGRLDDANRHFERALDLARAAAASDFTWPALLGLGDVAERRGNFVAALSYDRRAAALIDTLRARQGAEAQSIALFSHRLFAYEALIHLLGKLAPRFPDSAYAAEAFEWNERARARSFLDLLAASGSAAASGTAQPHPLALAEARSLIASDRDALLEYSLGDSSSSLWVITKHAWRRFALPPRPALRFRIETLRRALGSPENSVSRAARTASHALYAALIEPASSFLKGIDHLIVAPDGVLALIPFEALLATEADPDGPPRANAYLIERFAVSYAPSASALAALRAGDAGDAIVALGDPCFDCGADSVRSAGADVAPGAERRTPRLQALPNTAAEVTALARLAGSRPFTALTGRDATRERLLGLPALSTAAVVHVATHGVASEAEPEKSGLYLAPSAGGHEPGFISVSDIVALRLDAGLVTLSACETGLGKLERGEGVLGLTRAFLAAGARSVVVSLWSVNDRSTATLMNDFYRGLLGARESRARALAAAKRRMIHIPETRAPFYWAPFILVGEAGRLEAGRRRG